MLTASTRKLYTLGKEAEKISATNARKEKSLAPRRIPDADDEEQSIDTSMKDPLELLSIERHECRHLTEIHLGNREIKKLHPSFQNFVNLETLWLPNNQLTEIKGLVPNVTIPSVEEGARGCARLKCLYLSNNKLTTLAGDIAKLKYLEILLLANNALSNMEVISQQISHLRFLKQLDLFGNPLAEEQSYRSYFIFRHPHLELLDRETIAPAEREKAKAAFSKSALALRSSRVGFGSTAAPKEETTKVGLMSQSAKLVESKVKKIEMRDRAAAKMESEREESQHQARMEKRRLFHSIWSSKPLSSDDSGHQKVSKLFDLEDSNSDVARIIELARERETCESDERRATIEKEINSLKHLLMPERESDELSVAIERAKERTKADDEKEYMDKVCAAIFSSGELDSFQKLFDSGVVARNEVTGLLNALTGSASNELSPTAFKAFAEAKYPSTKKSSTVVPSVELKVAMYWLASWQPFLDVRKEQLMKEAQEYIFKKSNRAAAMQTTRRASALNDHEEKLRRDAVLESGQKAPAMGAAFVAVRSKHGGGGGFRAAP